MQSRDASDSAPRGALHEVRGNAHGAAPGAVPGAARGAARGAVPDHAHGEPSSTHLPAPVVPFRFACHRCGHCCSGGAGHVWLAPGESEQLAHALGLSASAFERQHVRTVVDPRTGELRTALREVNTSAERGGRCTLLAGSNTCTAYVARPEHCRTFPYWPNVLTDRAAFEAARATCPGIAVEVPENVRARAFAELAALYADAGPPRADETCCLASSRSAVVYATALEADFAAAELATGARADDQGESRACERSACRLGRGAPLACRLPAAPAPASDALFARVRAIERSNGYPAAYGRLAELLRARGAKSTLDGNTRADEDGSP